METMNAQKLTLKGDDHMKETDKINALAKKLRNEYNAQWRKQNPQKAKDYIKQYWIRKATEIMESENLIKP